MRYIVLTLLGVVAIFKRYKCHGGQLVQVIRRDGGMYYLCLIGQYSGTFSGVDG